PPTRRSSNRDFRWVVPSHIKRPVTGSHIAIEVSSFQNQGIRRHIGNDDLEMIDYFSTGLSGWKTQIFDQGTVTSNPQALNSCFITGAPVKPGGAVHI